MPEWPTNSTTTKDREIIRILILKSSRKRDSVSFPAPVLNKYCLFASHTQRNFR